MPLLSRHLRLPISLTKRDYTKFTKNAKGVNINSHINTQPVLSVANGVVQQVWFLVSYLHGNRRYQIN
jgi:hypothetical protein